MKRAALDLIDWGVYHFKVTCCHEIAPLETNVESKVKKTKTKEVSADEGVVDI